MSLLQNRPTDIENKLMITKGEREEEKIVSNDAPDVVLISKIYKKLIQLKSKKQKQKKTY